MNKVNRIIFEKQFYESEDDMLKHFNETLVSILKAGYVCVVNYKDDRLGVMEIQYEMDDIEHGAPHPFWLTPEEAHSSFINHKINKYQNMDEEKKHLREELKSLGVELPEDRGGNKGNSGIPQA